MRIVFLGSGNVATHLALAMQHAGHDIVQIYSRTIANAQQLASRLPACASTDDVGSLCANADVYVFSVKDDALPELAVQVRCDNPATVFLHTAGSVPLDVFAGTSAAHYGVLYPMQTFSKERDVDFREVPCFVEGNDEDALCLVRELSMSLSDSVHELSSERRKSLHLAAVFACNFANHCYHLADRVLSDAGLDFSLFLPLIDCTARKVHTMSPAAAQTGPAIRYDETVINRHLAMLGDPQMRAIYELMSQSIHNASRN